MNEIVGGGSRGEFLEYQRVAEAERAEREKQKESEEEAEERQEPMMPLSGKEKYEEKMQVAMKEDHVVVFKFSASWCRTCRAMAPKLKRLMQKYPLITSYEIDFENNKELCKELGILA